MAISDIDRIRDALCGAKERARLYAWAALESTNNGVREFFLAMHGEETHSQEILSSFLRTRGEWPTRAASPEAIREVRERFRQVHREMGLTSAPSFRRYHTADPRMHPAAYQRPEHYRAH